MTCRAFSFCAGHEARLQSVDFPEFPDAPCDKGKDHSLLVEADVRFRQLSHIHERLEFYRVQTHDFEKFARNQELVTRSHIEGLIFTESFYYGSARVVRITRAINRQKRKEPNVLIVRNKLIEHPDKRRPALAHLDQLLDPPALPLITAEHDQTGFLNQMLDLKGGLAHGDSQCLGFVGPGDGSAVIVGQHHHWLALQRRPEHPLTAHIVLQSTRARRAMADSAARE